MPKQEKVWVKICGISDEDTAKFACEQGVDAVGMLFSESSRQVTFEQAAKISAAVKEWPNVSVVGVFVNPFERDLEEAFQYCGLDLAQLHGDESLEFCKSLRFPYIRAFPVQSLDSVKKAIEGYPKNRILLDAYSKSERGGSGTTFSWNIASKVSRLGYPIVLAGGLNSENVVKAVHESEAVGVDVSSGVETNGRKDHNKIIKFIKNAKSIKL